MQAWSAYRATSLEVPRAGGDHEPSDTLGDTVGTIDDGFDRAEQRAVLDALMRSLSPRERQAVRLRFEEDLTQAAIGERIRVSQMQVSRLLQEALPHLRREADARSTDGKERMTWPSLHRNIRNASIARSRRERDERAVRDLASS
jgi:RNA polymerase sigma-B factor